MEALGLTCAEELVQSSLHNLRRTSYAERLAHKAHLRLAAQLAQSNSRRAPGKKRPTFKTWPPVPAAQSTKFSLKTDPSGTPSLPLAFSRCQLRMTGSRTGQLSGKYARDRVKDPVKSKPIRFRAETAIAIGSYALHGDWVWETS